MRSRELRLSLGVILGLTMVAIIFLAPSPAPSQPPEYTTVTLTFDPSNHEVKVDPENATISWNEHPNKVQWISANGTGYYWDLVWKEGDQPNYFNRNFDIKCDKSEVKSNIPSGRVSAGAQWPYAVVIYACDDHEKGEKLGEIDPRVDWRD